MKKILFILVLLGTEKALHAQYIYKIKADSVLITNSCDTAELIIENHTQTVPGFLFNKGRGRTEFRRVMQEINDTLVRIGADTLRLPNAWVQGGNRWNSTGVFGTIDNNHVDFYTNGLPRARLTDRGHLLIGTTDDRNGYGQADIKLQVNGSAWITQQGTDTLGVGGVFIQATGQETYMGNLLHFDMWPYSPTPNYSRILSPGGIVYECRTGGDQHIFANTQGAILTGTLVTLDPGPYPEFPANQLALRIATHNDKDVAVTVKGWTGIGTITPTAQLHTTGSVRFAGLTSNTSLSRVVVADDYGNLYYKDAASTFNGTLNSDLAVNGAVSAQKMLISQTGRWPDYVFNKQYQLPSLTEVENFINQNNHLPGVPSAAEVEKKGIDVAGNQAVLLKKIEELTLYVIELEKKSQKQSEEIGELKKMIKKNK